MAAERLSSFGSVAQRTEISVIKSKEEVPGDFPGFQVPRTRRQAGPKTFPRWIERLRRIVWISSAT